MGEFRAALQREELVASIKSINSMFAEIDSDGDNNLELAEIIDFYDTNEFFKTTLNRMDVHKAELPVIFDMLDQDSSGSLTFPEFVNGLHGLKNQNEHTLQVFTKHYCEQMHCDMMQKQRQYQEFSSSLCRIEKALEHLVPPELDESEAGDEPRDSEERSNFSEMRSRGTGTEASEVEDMNADIEKRSDSGMISREEDNVKGSRCESKAIDCGFEEGTAQSQDLAPPEVDKASCGFEEGTAQSQHLAPPEVDKVSSQEERETSEGTLKAPESLETLKAETTVPSGLAHLASDNPFSATTSFEESPMLRPLWYADQAPS